MDLNEDWFDKTKNKQISLKQLLNENEKVLWKGCPKKSSYAISKSIAMMPIGILWGLIDFGLIAMLLSGAIKDAPPSLIFALIPFFAIHLTPFWIWLYKLIKSSSEMKNTYYLITNERIICIKGKTPYIDNVLNINELQHVKLSRKFIDKLLRVGDITVSGESGTLTLYDIPDSEFITQKLNKLISNNNKYSEFYKNYSVCSHCGSAFNADLNKCPNCGASKEIK